MKSRKLMYIQAVTLFAALGLPVQLAAQERQQPNLQLQHYTVIDLGTLGGTFSEPSGINSKKWVAGRATLPGDSMVHATLWRDEQKTDLGTLGGPNSWAWVPGDNGIIPGQAETSSPDPLREDFCGFGTNLVCLAFLWQGGAMSALPTLGGDNGVAVEINRRGQVVGFTENATHDSTCLPPQVLQVVAVIWRSGKIEQQLAPFPGDTAGFAQAVNENGHVTGSTGPCAPVRAVLWRGGAVIDLGSLGGSLNNFPFDINNRDEVVGDSDLAGDTTQHAFLWTNQDGMQDLGVLPGDTDSSTESINNRGQVAGVSYTTVSSRAFLWQNGVMTDLNTLACPGSIFLANALGINDQGLIIGDTVTSSGEVHAYLATPTDECDSKAPSSAEQANSTISLPDSVRKMLRDGMARRNYAPWFKRKAQEPGYCTIDDGLGKEVFHGSGACQLVGGTMTGECIEGGRCIGGQSTMCPAGKKGKLPTAVHCLNGQFMVLDNATSCKF